ncbi:MAG: hypothetical protein KAS96_02855 [Planctomycetes bacterium]|nr:hypothetical protein [Planctomycetota bacterium]
MKKVELGEYESHRSAKAPRKDKNCGEGAQKNTFGVGLIVVWGCSIMGGC